MLFKCSHIITHLQNTVKGILYTVMGIKYYNPERSGAKRNGAKDPVRQPTEDPSKFSIYNLQFSNNF